MSLQIFIKYCLPAVLDVGGASISIRKPMMGIDSSLFPQQECGIKSHLGTKGVGGGSSREPVRRLTGG